MLKNLSQKLIVRAISVVTGIAVISTAEPSEAAVFFYNFTVNDAVDQVTGIGSFSYDDSDPRIVTPSGDTLKVSSLHFSWLGKVYSAADDSRLDLTPDLSPAIYVKQGTSNFLNALDFVVDTPNQIFAFEPTFNGGSGSTLFSAFSPQNASYKAGTVTFTAVPEPNSILGLSVFSLGALLMLKKRGII